MKKLVLFFFSISVFAQDYGNNAETLKLCTTLQANSFSSNLDADGALDRILEVVGLSKNFVLAPCSDINNAVAVSFRGVRYILYDPEFMSMLSRNTSNWTSLFILAHEVGHHVNGHSLDLVLYAGEIVDAPELKKKRDQELEADEFAGFVLAKLGASLTQTTSSVSKLSNEDDTYSTHPKRDKRINSIKNGWNRGKPKNTKTLPPTIQKRTTSTTHSDWKTLIEYPSERIKESNNPFKVEKKYNSSIEVTKTSMVEGKLIEDNTKNWPSWVSELGRMIKNEISDFGKPYIEIVQTKNKDSQHIGSSFYFQLPELEYLFQYEKAIEYTLEIYIDDNKFYSHTLRVWGLDRSYNNGKVEYWPYSWDKHREDQSQTKVLVTMKGIESNSFISHLKKGKKMFLRINIEREIKRGGPMSYFTGYYKLHPFYNYCSSECFNTYEFSLSGSSKALSF